MENIETPAEKPVETPAPGSETKPSGDVVDANAEGKPAEGGAEATPPAGEPEAIDYKTELEKSNAKLEKAEYKLTQQSIDQRKAKESDDSGNEPSEVQEVVSSELNKFREDMTRDHVESELSKIENPDERELVRFHYTNTLNKTGSSQTHIAADVENARILANKSKILAREKEVMKAVEAEKSKGRSGDVAGTAADASKPIDVSPMEEKILTNAGVNPEDVGSDIGQLIEKDKQARKNN